jgi:predicted Zn-dependent peptidase|tara:strand:- start:41 stop:310 length:270 start_codon:yes stop_codon:yes gene_type:complete
MEKIIFFGLVIPILAFVLYLGGTAIMNGFSAKSANKSIDKEEEDISKIKDSDASSNQLSNELNELNKLLKDGVLTQEEFEKAKKKILEN